MLLLSTHSTQSCYHASIQHLAHRLKKMEEQGQLILLGDFNAKLEIEHKGRIIQNQSRNGGLLQNLIDKRKMAAPNIDPTKMITGQQTPWTRVKRLKPSERSIIDYILTSKSLNNNIEEVSIDTEGEIRLRGQKDSDHNTITMTINQARQRIINHAPKQMETGQHQGMAEIQQTN